jgi:hypothetical protein
LVLVVFTLPTSLSMEMLPASGARQGKDTRGSRGVSPLGSECALAYSIKV